MIEIKDKRDCCGCGACVQRCPKQCIAMHEDAEGFLYPKADQTQCIDCGLCEKVCPVINKAQEHQPLRVYAAKHGDDAVRMSSSSGGVFSAIAERTIAKGGVVFGARFDKNWEVEHAYAETIDGLAQFRGSKYVQSRIGNTFLQAEQFLKQGREVLFSGTPCQIAGLKRFLRKEYPNLIAVDIVCHSVPSPGMWRRYLAETVGTDQIQSVAFRDKVSGWKNYSISIQTNCSMYSQQRDDAVWMRSLLEGLTVRRSCYQCPAKCKHSSADITLGDFWGINQLCPEIDDDRGVTLVIEHNERNLVKIAPLRELTFETVAQYNSALIQSPTVSPKRAKFQAAIGDSLSSALQRYSRRPLLLTIRITISRTIRKILHI
jgi:coenzyme F420-reducing hydrogenase beta subunit